MNIDDKTINLSTEEAKMCGKSVETDTEDEAIKANLMLCIGLDYYIIVVKSCGNI